MKSVKFLLISLLSILLLSTTLKSQEETGDQIATKGIFYYQSMRIDESIELLMKALEMGIEDIKLKKSVIFHLAKGLLVNKNEELGRKYMCDLKSEFPDFDKEEILSPKYQELFNSCEAKPCDDNCYYNKGLEFMQKNNCVEARDNFIKALDINDHNPHYYLKLGVAWDCLGNSSQAESNYNKALKLDKNLTDAYYMLASNQFEQNRCEDAQKTITIALKLEPDNKEFIKLKGKIETDCVLKKKGPFLGLTTKRIVGLTFLAGSGVFGMMGKSKDQSVNDFQSTYANESTSYEQLLKYKSDRDSAEKDRNNYYKFSIGAGVIGGALLIWDFLSNDDNTTSKEYSSQFLKKTNIFTTNDLSVKQIIIGIRKYF